MNTQNFDYKYQYANWHQTSEEALAEDISRAKTFCDNHNLYPTNKNAKILDLGCGTGIHLSMLKRQGYTNLLGVDIDSSQINTAKANNCNVILQNALEFLKKDNNIYDGIYCLDLLEHLEKNTQIDFLKEIYNHLDENGFAVLRIPNAIAPLANYFRYQDFTHITAYTSNSLNFLCKNAGFKYIHINHEHQEAPHVMYLKRPWGILFEQEYGLKNVILTPNIVTILFKNETSYKNYLQNVKPIINDYTKSFKYNRFIERIFSIKRFYHFKIITILGIKFKLKKTIVSLRSLRKKLNPKAFLQNS